jgi:hypothetical protein
LAIERSKSTKTAIKLPSYLPILSELAVKGGDVIGILVIPVLAYFKRCLARYHGTTTQSWIKVATVK